MADSLDLVWGAAAIAVLIGKSERATRYILDQGGIPPAKKVGGRWVVSRAALVAYFSGEAA